MKEKLYAGLTFDEVVDYFSDTITGICAVRCCNIEDVHDCYQNVFLALIKTDTEFNSIEHLKAWLIKVSVYKSESFAKQFWKRNVNLLEDLSQENVVLIENNHFVNYSFDDDLPYRDELLKAVFNLPLKYRQVIYMYYFEEMKIKDISEALKKKESTIKSQLKRAKEILKKSLKGGIGDEIQ